MESGSHNFMLSCFSRCSPVRAKYAAKQLQKHNHSIENPHTSIASSTTHPLYRRYPLIPGGDLLSHERNHIRKICHAGPSALQGGSE